MKCFIIIKLVNLEKILAKSGMTTKNAYIFM